MHSGTLVTLLLGFVVACVTAGIIVETVLIEKRRRMELELKLLKEKNRKG